jgi:hypothetical protein
MTDSPSLLKDRDGAPIQTLIPDDTTVASLTSGADSTSAALPADPSGNVAIIVEVTASNFCYIAFGADEVEASTASRLMSPGSRVYRVPPGATTVAVLELGGNAAAVSITRLY